MRSQRSSNSGRLTKTRRTKNTIRCRRAKTLKVVESEGEQSDTLSELCMKAGFNMYELGPPQLISSDFQELLNDLQKKNNERAGEIENANDANDQDIKPEQPQQKKWKTIA